VNSTTLKNVRLGLASGQGAAFALDREGRERAKYWKRGRACWQRRLPTGEAGNLVLDAFNFEIQMSTM
jgi:hypothetical protein